MASSTTQTDRFKPNSCSNRSRKVRIVAKIRGFTDQETESLNRDSAPWVSVWKPKEDSSDEKTTISFGDQSTREAYAMDYCYEQSEDNGIIYSSEIKPLISRIFDGQSITIIAYGARGSGKTYTIQGTREKQGLAALVCAEVLQMAEDNQKSIAISIYEVFQDRVYDLLDSNRSEVQVLEDAQGKIKLKGLSQAFVKSIAEFQKLYFPECSSRRTMQKAALEMSRRSHKGLIIHLICNSGSSTKLLGKIHFVDLAGYEDAKKSSEGLNIFESGRVNKSLYALLNVVHALNGNETRVPYRDSKLTRVLQDSFEGTNHVVMLTCLNPSFCQDTIYATSLASRSCQGVSRVSTISSKKSSISAKPITPSSLTKGRVGIVSATTNKSNNSRACFSAKTNSFLVKGRKLFVEGDHLLTSEKAKAQTTSAMQPGLLSHIGSAIVPSLQESVKEQEESVSDSFSAANEETSLLNAPEDTKPIEEKGVLLCNENNHEEVTIYKDRKITPLCYWENGDNIEKENKNLLIRKQESPPLSARLQELSNKLKSLYSSTPLQFKLPHETDTSSNALVVCVDAVEPKTPIAEQSLQVKDKWEVDNCRSATYSARSSGLRHSFVQDYLQFLNSANKDELKGSHGIGEKRANYILQLREQSPEPFKQLDDLKDIGLSAKQIKGMLKKVAGGLFS